MKTRLSKPQDQFKPFSIEITFESEEEAADMYAIMNYSPIANSVCFRSAAIRNVIRGSISDESRSISFDKISHDLKVMD